MNPGLTPKTILSISRDTDIVCKALCPILVWIQKWIKNEFCSPLVYGNYDYGRVLNINLKEVPSLYPHSWPLSLLRENIETFTQSAFPHVNIVSKANPIHYYLHLSYLTASPLTRFPNWRFGIMFEPSFSPRACT